jgi:protein required for attachment to host cells
MNQQNKTWLVVADGAKARIFSVSGGDSGLAELHDLIAQEQRSSHEIGSERPGRTQESANAARHAIEPRVDWHTQAKQEFARAIATLVNDGATKGAYESLVLVAPPEALGHLRKLLDRRAQARVSSEVDKDLTKLTPHALQLALKDVLPPLEPPPRNLPGR